MFKDLSLFNTLNISNLSQQCIDINFKKNYECKDPSRLTQPSSVASYHGSAMSASIIRCRRSYCRAPWTEGVAEVDRVSRGRTTSRNGRASPRCGRWAAITAEASVGYPNDAWASRPFTGFDLLIDLSSSLSHTLSQRCVREPLAAFLAKKIWMSVVTTWQSAIN